MYAALAKTEKTGNEHGAFVWFCEYLEANQEQKTALLKDAFVADYFRRLSEGDFAKLKKYVRQRYLLDVPDKDLEYPARIFLPKVKITGVNREEIIAMHEFITFNNPRRELWEKTSKVIEFLKIKEGDAVADIGCGPGYYTFKFAKLVGPNGKFEMAGGSPKIELKEPFYVGIGVCSHDKDVVERAVFSNVELPTEPINAAAKLAPATLYSVLETVPIDSGDRSRGATSRTPGTCNR